MRTTFNTGSIYTLILLTGYSFFGLFELIEVGVGVEVEGNRYPIQTESITAKYEYVYICIAPFHMHAC